MCVRCINWSYFITHTPQTYTHRILTWSGGYATLTPSPWSATDVLWCRWAWKPTSSSCLSPFSLSLTFLHPPLLLVQFIQWALLENLLHISIQPEPGVNIIYKANTLPISDTIWWFGGLYNTVWLTICLPIEVATKSTQLVGTVIIWKPSPDKQGTKLKERGDVVRMTNEDCSDTRVCYFSSSSTANAGRCLGAPITPSPEWKFEHDVIMVWCNLYTVVTLRTANRILYGYYSN